MNKIMMLAVMLLGMVTIATDADAARRLGGGSNFGSQRSITPAPKAPAQQAAPAPTNTTQQPAGNKWLGPLAGLALGAGLASLFFNNGFAGALGGILMVLLVVAAAVFAMRLLRSKLQPPSRPLQYAGAGMPRIGSDLSSHFGGGAAAAVKRFPPGFDADQFARHAKSNFTRLQAANDARDLSTMRDFMTPELYTEIVADLDARVPAPQKTDVVSLDAEVIEVVTEGERYIASVRFSGTIRDSADAAAEPFSEVWHLAKPVDGSSGWLISGHPAGLTSVSQWRIRHKTRQVPVPHVAVLFRPPFAAAINHLLKSASWARNKLTPHAGKTARFDVAPFALTLAILPSGEVEDGSAIDTTDVRFTLTPGVALRLLAASEDAWREVRVDGDTALARDILYVAQNLRWDAEEDLSRIFGDIAAHRLVRAGGNFRHWQRDSAEHLARSAAVYWTEEDPLIATRYDIEYFLHEVDVLRDDVARAEKRIAQFTARNVKRGE